MAPVSPAPGPPGEARTIDAGALRRGVRLELFVAPVAFALPVIVGWAFIDVGLRYGLPRYVGLGALLMAGNVAFSLLMVRSALRFLRRTREAA